MIGSRGSKLALWQAEHIQKQLHAMGAETRIAIIKTSGDKIQDVPLAKVGGKGLFTKEIEEALLDHSIDLAVHSMKDVPTEMPQGLTIAAIPEREEARDALIGKRLDELADGARIGTSSLRRSSQLRALNPKLEILMLRGNVDTRLRKLDEGEYDAIVLAAAGLRRLGWAKRIAGLIPADVMCPAVGQGALAIQTRAGDHPARELAERLDHGETRTAVLAERAFLGVLGGGCQVPVGAHATVDGGIVHLRALIASPDGGTILRGEEKGADAHTAGVALGERLLGEGGREILDQAYREA